MSGADGTDRKLLNQLLKLEFGSIDWFNPKIARKLGANRASSIMHPLDFYCTTQGVKALCDYAHRTFSGIGVPDTSTLGFTMATWGAFYIDHLEVAFSLGTVAEQVAWLDESSLQFQLFWGVVHDSIHRFIYSSQLDSATLVSIAPFDCQPAQHLRSMQKNLAALDAAREALTWISPAASAGKVASTTVLPQLSLYSALVKKFVPIVGATKSGKRPLDTNSGGGGDKESTVGQAPGSQSTLWIWLTLHKLLLFQRTVWDVAQICIDFKIPDAAKICWAFLLTFKKGQNRLSVCDKVASGDARHKGEFSDAHVLVKGVDSSDPAFSAKYSRKTTEEELAKLLKVKGKGDGGGGRGGGGRGEAMTFAHALVSSLAAWTTQANVQDLGPNGLCASSYLAKMSISSSPGTDGTYLDSGGLMLIADQHLLRVVVRLFDARGREVPSSPQVFLPREGISPDYEIRL